MAKKILKLTEEESKSIVAEEVSSLLKENRGAALVQGANCNAETDYLSSHNSNARTKMDRAEEITLPALNKAVNDNFLNLVLEFVEQNQYTRRAYGVDLRNVSVKYIDNTRCVLQGQLTVANKPFGLGTIEYQFSSGVFYRVLYSDKTARSRKLHTLILHNKTEGKQLFSFLSQYLYAQEDYENDVNVNGASPSKKH